MTVYLDTEHLVRIADRMGNGAVRDIGLLDAAAHRPRASVFGEDAYPDLPRKAAALLCSIVRNHALVDGNKRLSWVATVVFLDLNGFRLTAPDTDAAYDLVIAAATGEWEVAEVSERLAAWVTPCT